MRRRLIGRIDRERRACERAFGIAMGDDSQIADPDSGRHKALAGIERGSRRLSLVLRRQQRRAFARRFQRLGDHHCDRLVDVTHPIVLQQLHPEHEGIGLGVRILRKRGAVLRGHDLDDAGMALGRGDIQ